MVTRIASIFTSLIDVIVNNICEEISYLYSLDYDPVPPVLKKAAFNQPCESLSEDNSNFDFNRASYSPPEPSAVPPTGAPGENVNSNTEKRSGTTPKKGKRRARIQRPPEREEVDEQKEPELFRVTESKLDLFAELGITKEDYVAEATRIAETNTAAAGNEELVVSTESEVVKTAFRQLAKYCHESKMTNKSDELKALAADKWCRIDTAHKILLDTNSLQAKKYVYFYEQNEGGLNPPLSIDRLMNSSPAAPASSAPSPTEPPRSGTRAKPDEHREQRHASPPKVVPVASPAPIPDWRAPSEFPVSQGAHPQSFHASSRTEKEKSPPRVPDAVTAGPNASTTNSTHSGEKQTARSFRRKGKPPAVQKEKPPAIQEGAAPPSIYSP